MRSPRDCDLSSGAVQIRRWKTVFSNPLMKAEGGRGTAGGHDRHHHLGRLIPARAGNSWGRSTLASSSRVNPRARR